MNPNSSVPISRVKSKDLGLSVRPKVLLGESECELYEFSENSLTVFAPRTAALAAGSPGHSWQMRVDDTTLWDGTAEIESLSPTRNGTRVTLNVSSIALDVQTIIRRSRQADCRARLRVGVVRSDALVPVPYKAFCAEVSSNLRGYRQLAEQMDRDAVFAVGKDGEVDFSLFEECAQRMISDWRRFGEIGTGLCLPYLADPERLSALRDFTQRLVTSELKSGAGWRRAFEKPRGYPGDYGVMNYVYDGSDIGESIYARLCHRLSLDFGACIGTRKNAVKDEIVALLAKGAPVASTSIACGSAQEIFELATQDAISAPLTATLLDQDSEALGFATNRLQLPMARHSGKLRVDARPAHFGDFTDRGGAVPSEQDLIYCFGMFDYLPDATITKITENLYEKLRPGGSLILGNLKSPSDKVWGLSLVLGYDMWFRGESQMFALARSLPGARAELKLEATGHNYLLFVHKP